MSEVFNFVNNDEYRGACEIGTTFQRSIIIYEGEPKTPKNLTGFTSTFIVYDADDQAILSPTVSAGDATGMLTATSSATDTASIPPGMHTYKWTILNAGVVIRELSGQFEVTK